MKKIVCSVVLAVVLSGVAFAQRSPGFGTTPSVSSGSSFVIDPVTGQLVFSPSTSFSSSAGSSLGSFGAPPSSTLFAPSISSRSAFVTPGFSTATPGFSTQGAAGGSSMAPAMMGFFGSPTGLNPFSVFAMPTTLNPFSFFFGNTSVAPSPVVPSTVQTP